MKLVKLLALASLVALATSCAQGDGKSKNGNSGGNAPTGNPQAPGPGGGNNGGNNDGDQVVAEPGGAAPISQRPWCFTNPSASGYTQYRFMFTTGGVGSYAEFNSDARATRGAKKGEASMLWSLNGADLTITIQNQSQTFPIRLDPAGPTLYLRHGTGEQAMQGCL